MLIKLERRIINLEQFKEIFVEDDGLITILYKENKDGEQIYSIIDVEDFDCWDEFTYKRAREKEYDHKDLRWIKMTVAFRIVDLIYHGLVDDDERVAIQLDKLVPDALDDAIREYEEEADE